MCTNHETTGKWVVVVNDYEGPEGEETLRQTLSYGFFDSQEEAIQYGVDNKFVERYGYFHVPEVLNKDYHEDPNDYVGMGWVGSDGRP